MTANLAGPLVINTKTLQGRQIILNPDKYPLKFRVFSEK
jgi:flagellar assembly factor FliW